MTLAPVYLLSSDDPFLKTDRSTKIMAQARSLYPDAELMIFTASDFGSGVSANLSVLEGELIDPGLFGGSRIIKIYLSEIEKSISVQVLHLLSKYTREGLVCIVDLPRMKADYNKAIKSPKPYSDDLKGQLGAKAKQVVSFLGNIGASLEIMYPPEGNELKSFIRDRAHNEYALNVDDAAVEVLALNCEGNLVAVDQFLQIAKLSSNDLITTETVNAYLNHNSRYSGFEFTDAVLNAQTPRALNILSSLKETEGSSLSQVLMQIISGFDNALNAIYDLKHKSDLLKGYSNYAARTAFFAPRRILSPHSQDAIILAAKNMPDDLYDYLVQSLAEASAAVKFFDIEKAFMYLQNMAVSVKHFRQISSFRGMLCQ